ncbi:UNVERIFIED_CONTAM: hypothetical protein FKN15_034365 [Acipenser sinensis]
MEKSLPENKFNTQSAVTIETIPPVTEITAPDETVPATLSKQSPCASPLTPRLPSSAVKQIKESLALLELDFAEFRELMLARLTEAIPTQQLRDEVALMKRENRAAINELRAELKGLQQENETLRSELSKTRDEQRRNKTLTKEPAEDDVVRGLNTGNGTGPHKYCEERRGEEREEECGERERRDGDRAKG